MPNDKALIGAAGEHYVASRLLAKGYAVGFTPSGTQGVDLLVTDLDSHAFITIQVKTMYDARAEWGGRKYEKGSGWKWRIGTRSLQSQDRLFYCFVDLRNDASKLPCVFITPSHWLFDPSSHLLEQYPEPEDGPVRDAWCVIDEKRKTEYLNRWDLIVDALQ